MRNTNIGPLVSIRALREVQGLTSAKLAAKIGDLGVSVNESRIRQIETGRGSPSAELGRAWAVALGLAPSDIFYQGQLAEYLRESDLPPRRAGRRPVAA